MYKFQFADIGEGLHEGKVGQVYVKEGQVVKEGDSLFSVETDKVTSDIPAPTSGKISKILIETGQTIHVGDDIFHIDNGGDDASSKVVEKVVESNPKISSDVVTSAQEKNISQPQSRISSGRVFSTPYARKLAAKKGVDINKVTGSGFNKRVLVKDIENFNSSNINQVNVSNFKKIQPFSQQITPMRKAIAKAMKNSWSSVAYTNLTNEVNMTKIWEERKMLNEETMDLHKTKVSFTALAAIATIQALRKFPQFNSQVDQANNLLKHDGVINLGIAVDTPKGLFVPVIKNADQMNIIQLAQSIVALATKAKKGELTIDDMSGGTFTLTNYGSAGAMWGVPVINYPEVGILGTGTIVDRVYADSNGSFYNGKVMNLTLAADHRWVDGADVGRFISFVKKLLENPILLLGGY